MDKLEFNVVVTNADSELKGKDQSQDVRVKLNECEYISSDKYNEQELQKIEISPNEKETCIIIPDGKEMGGDMNQNYKAKEHKDQRGYYDQNTRTAYVSDGGPYQARVAVVEGPPRNAGHNTQDVDYDRRGRNSREYYQEVVIVFQDQSIRHDFIRKVYLILAVMLLYTFGFIALCIFEKYTKLWVLEHFYVVFIALGVWILSLFPLICCNCARRIFPLNFILLSVMTASMAYVTAYTSCHYNTQIIMSAFGGTALICILVTFIAWQDWFDVTTWGMYLCIAAMVVMVYGLVAMIIYLITGNTIVYLIYSCICCLLFSMFLLYDTQQIVGGKRIQLSPEEYILGAVQLYIDIMTIFILILDIFAYFQ